MSDEDQRRDEYVYEWEGVPVDGMLVWRPVSEDATKLEAENPPVMTAEQLRALGHPNPKLGEGLSKMGFETRPGHTWRRPSDEA